MTIDKPTGAPTADAPGDDEARATPESGGAVWTEGGEDTSPFGIEYARPDRSVKPIYLLADSQLLFWQQDGRPFMAGVRAQIASPAPRAAYVGASNGDDPAYYSIFRAAMDEAGIEECRMVPTEMTADDLAWVDQAHLILLAGGDVARGWSAFEANGLKQIVVRRYYEGALLMGVSAGAVQLGLAGWSGRIEEAGGAASDDPSAGAAALGELIDTFRILPHLVGAHEEGSDWVGLKAAVARMGGHVRGYGIPLGGGFAYHRDHIIEPLRLPLVELRMQGGAVESSLLLPGVETDPERDEPPSDDERGGGGALN